MAGFSTDPAEDARVEVPVGAGQLDLDRHDPPQGVGQGGHSRGGHPGVGHHHRIAAEFGLPTFHEKAGQAVAADLLLALDQEGQVGQLRAGLEAGLDGVEVGEVLALVVAGPAGGEQRATTDAGLERR